MRMLIGIAVAIVGVLALSSCGASKEAAKIEGATESSAATTTSTRTPENTATPILPSPTATATPRPATLTKVSEAFAISQNSYDAKYSHDWVVMLSNETNQFANFVRVQALFYSSTNVLLGTSEDFAYVWPGQTSPAHGSNSYAERATRMEVRVEAKPKFTDVKTQTFPRVAEVEIARDKYSAKVTGKTTSPWSTDVENLEVVCVLRDAGGVLVGVANSYLELLPGEATAVVECSYISSDIAAKATTAEMYLVFSSISKTSE